MTFGLFALVENYDNNAQKAIKEQLELAIVADKLGFKNVWFGEHHFNSFSVVPDPLSMLSYLAAKTTNIRLGAAGFLAPFYHSVRLAESIATLDHLSGGRVDAGFAKGGFAPDTKHILKSGADLRELMSETLEAIELLLVQKTKYNGKFIKLEDANIEPKSYQAKIPFYVATFATKETIEFAANHGYGLLMSQGASLEDCINAQELYYKTAGFYPHMVIMRVLYIDKKSDEIDSELRVNCDYFIKCMRAAMSEQTQPLFDETEYKKLLKERESFFDGEKFIQNAIYGTPTECIEQIKPYQKAIKNLQISFKPASRKLEKNIEMLKILSEEVFKYF